MFRFNSVIFQDNAKSNEWVIHKNVVKRAKNVVIFRFGLTSKMFIKLFIKFRPQLNFW